MLGCFFVDALSDDTGLGSEKEVVWGDIQNLVHVNGAQDDGFWDGDASPAEAGSGATGDDGDFV